jgi:hypothetical protein
MKYRYLVRLFLINVFLLIFFNIQGQQITSQRIQLQIDSLKKPPGSSSSFEFDFSQDPVQLSNQWQKITGLYFFPCNGDLCSEQRFGLVHIQNQDTIDAVFRMVDVFQGNIFLLTDQWAVLTDNNLKVIKVFEEAAILSADYIKIRSGNRWGMLDKNLDELIPAHYENLVLWEYGYGFIGDETPYILALINGNWGVVNLKNEFVVAAQYQSLYPLQGFVLSARKGKVALINYNGEVLTPFKYDTIYYDFSNSLVAKFNDNLGLLSESGKEMTLFQYSAFGQSTLYGCRCAKKGAKWGVLSSSGKELTQFIFDEVLWYRLDQIPLRKNNKWGFYDCKNQRESTPFIYEKVVRFFGVEAEVSLNGIIKRVKLE